MRNAECGVRNGTENVAPRATFRFNSAFRIPDSELGVGGAG